MARPASFNKRDVEKKKQSKRLAKEKKKEERKSTEKGKSFEDMIAYVDENGMIVDTPPEIAAKSVNSEDIMISTPKKDESQEPEKYKGRVEHLNDLKGYGFIKDLAGVEKYFFHVSNCPRDIAEGQIVFFQLARGKKGMNAVDIEHSL